MKYKVTIEVKGNFDVIVEAKNLEDAKKQASKAGHHVDCRSIRNINREISKVKNLETNESYYF